MRPVFLSLTILCMSISASCGDWRLLFKNGDSLACKSILLSEDGRLSISGSEFDAVEMGRAIQTLDSCRRQNPKPQSGNFLIHLRNSDSLRGDVQEISDGTVSLRSDPAGNIRIPLAGISGFTVLDEKSSASSPDLGLDWKDLSKWKILPERFAKNVSFVEGKLLLKGPVMASIPFPRSRTRISFSSMMNFDYGLALMMYAKLTKETPESYTFNLTPYSVDLRKKVPGIEKSLGNKQMNQTPFESSVVKFEILADRDKGIFEIAVNDGARFKIVDKDEKKPSGDEIVFACPANFAIISDLRISEWDGSSMAAEKETAAEPGDSPEDVVFLRNNDSMKGRLVQIAGQQIEFKTAFGDLEIPAARVARIAMGTPADQGTDSGKQPPAGKHPHVLRLGTNGSLQAGLKRIDAEKICFEHSILGDVSLAIGFVDAIDSNGNGTAAAAGVSIFDEIFKTPPGSVDALDPEIEEKLEEELGEIMNLFY